MTADTPAARPSAPPSDPRERCTNAEGKPAAIDEAVDEVCGTGFYHLEMLAPSAAFLQLGERVFVVSGLKLQVRYRDDRPGRSGDGDPTPPESLAQQFHEAYERLAPSFGYATREASAKPWAEVPENNRRLMTAVCAEILASQRAARARAEEDSARLDWLARFSLTVEARDPASGTSWLWGIGGASLRAAIDEAIADAAPAGQPEAASRDD